MTRRIRLAGMVSVAVVMFLAFAPGLRAGEAFTIKDGDRIAFYGDSITDQRLYTTFVETYIVTRFPSLGVFFVHSGWGGDRVTGGGGGPVDRRLERDVFAYKPTVVTVMLGMNDASYRAFDQKIFDVYANGYRHLVESLKTNIPGVRLTLIVPSPFDDVTRKPTFEGGYNQVLIRYGEFVKSLAEKEGATVADLNTSVVAALKKALEISATGGTGPDPRPRSSRSRRTASHGRGAPQSMERTRGCLVLELDAASRQVTKAENTTVDQLEVKETISWSQHDAALPMPIDQKNNAIALAVKASDVQQALNQQTLKVSGLDAPGMRSRLMVRM